jgi:hypothetical protein
MRAARRVMAAALLVGGCAAAALAPPAPAAPAAAPAAGWVPTLPVTQQSWQMLSAFPDGTAYAFDRGSDAMTLWHSADYGLAWDPLTYLPAGADTFLSVRFADPTTGYAVDGPTLLRTTDGATTAASWRPMARPALPGRDSLFADALGVAGHTVAFGGEVTRPLHTGCNYAAFEAIWTSHDGGRHWLTARLPASTEVSQISYLDDRLGVAVAYDMKDDPADSLGPCTLLGDRTSLWVTRDGGRHFTRAYRCGTVDVGSCWTARFLTATTLLAGRNNGTTVVSRDGGRSFHEGAVLGAEIGRTGTGQDSDFWVQGFDFVNQVVYATTKLAGAFRSTDLGRTWTREPSCDSAYSLGIGEVAAFDAQRAIAGGPTCVATRVSAPTGPVAAVGHRTTASAWADVVQRAGRRQGVLHGGALLTAP